MLKYNKHDNHNKYKNYSHLIFKIHKQYNSKILKVVLIIKTSNLTIPDEFKSIAIPTHKV